MWRSARARILGICLSDRLGHGAAVVAERQLPVASWQLPVAAGLGLVVSEVVVWGRWRHGDPRDDGRRDEQIRGLLSAHHLDGVAVRPPVSGRGEPRGGVRFSSAVQLEARARALGFVEHLLLGTGMELHLVPGVWMQPEVLVWGRVRPAGETLTPRPPLPEVEGESGTRWRWSRASPVREACVIADGALRMLARMGMRIEA